jgi:energy-coupling factor transporter ATP-binding protein EcfA2
MNVISRALRKVDSRDNWAFYGVIIGTTTSGKTTLALTLASLFTHMYSNSKCYITTNLDYLNDLSGLNGKNIAIVFDDVSNRIKRYSDTLTKLYTVRHPSNEAINTINKNIFMLFNCHYMRSIAPFIRSTPLRILTSITESEIRAYASEYLFTISTLWDYLHYYYKYEDKYIVLISVYGREHIMDVSNFVLNECEVIE